MSYEQILYSVDDHVATITLHRPEQLNAFTGTMMREMIDAFDQIDADDDVRAVIVTGAGRAFCAGADLSGGGDTFAGGFIGYLARTQDHSFDNLKRAIIVGSAMASFTCEKFGIERLAEVSREDIDARIQQFVELVDFDIELVEG